MIVWFACIQITSSQEHSSVVVFFAHEFQVPMGAYSGYYGTAIFPADGEFRAMMQVHIQNDGPVTLALETPQLPPPKEVRIIC